MGLMRSRCPEAAWGLHGEPNTSGNCPYCGRRIYTRPRPYNVGPRTRGELLGRRADVDAWGLTHLPSHQDPEIDPDPDDTYFD
jgi:hypothetical protein